MMGSTLAANLSAEAVTVSTALLRATWRLGLPRVTPRALAAARACRVRVEIRARSFSASAAKRCRTKGSTSGPKLGDQEGDLVGHEATDEVNVAAEAVQLGHRLVTPEFPSGG